MTINCNQCVAPFIQIMLDPSGRASPCAILDGLWKFNDETSVEDIWNNPQLESLRDNHKNNIRDPLCDTCWNTEDNGLQSHRERLNNSDKYDIDAVVDSIKTNTYKDGPLNIHLKNGNVCNLKCRICGPKDSIAWIPEAKDYKKQYPNEMSDTFFDIEAYKRNWTDNQLDQLMRWNTKLQRIEHFGGEALYNPKVLKHMNMLIDNGISKNITLYFNTNSDHTPNDKWWTAMSKFKALEFQLSLDGYEEQFEYQRHPAKWENVLKFRNWLDKKKSSIPIKYGINTTVNIMNVFYLPETVDYFLKIKKMEVLKMYPFIIANRNSLTRLVNTEDFLFLNILSFPAFYNIQNMPDKIKHKVEQKLTNSKHSYRFNETIKYMWQNKSTINSWKQFHAWTERQDKFRKQSFSKTFSEFSQLM